MDLWVIPTAAAAAVGERILVDSMVGALLYPLLKRRAKAHLRRLICEERLHASFRGRVFDTWQVRNNPFLLSGPMG